MYYLYIILGVYYLFGISYFIYKDYNYAKNNKNKNIINIDQDELFDKLIEP